MTKFKLKKVSALSLSTLTNRQKPNLSFTTASMQPVAECQLMETDCSDSSGCADVEFSRDSHKDKIRALLHLAYHDPASGDLRAHHRFCHLSSVQYLLTRTTESWHDLLAFQDIGYTPFLFKVCLQWKKYTERSFLLWLGCKSKSSRLSFKSNFSRTGSFLHSYWNIKKSVDWRTSDYLIFR